jgi:hypothetical protein
MRKNIGRYAIKNFLKTPWENKEKDIAYNDYCHIVNLYEKTFSGENSCIYSLEDNICL